MFNMPRPEVKPIFILSDGTGETAEKMVRAVLRQFSGYLVHVQIYPNIINADLAQDVFTEAKEKDALVVSTLVHPETRTIVQTLAQENRVRHLELLSPLLTQMSHYLRATPTGVPNQMHIIDDDYIRRINAIEFTVKGDDGKEPRMLHLADIVLLGVSRTSKTPLSVYLAHKGYRVCNIPIVLEKDLPDNIFDINQNRIFALTIEAQALSKIRTKRLKTMGVGCKSSYGDMDHILAELDWANSIFESNDEWPLIDITERAVEETAAIIINIMNDRGLSNETGDYSQL